MKRYFNTEGPVVAEEHYHVRPLDRINLPEVLDLIREKKYFVLHAPRQTGKTSTLLALRDLLNSGAKGDYRCVYANIEAVRAFPRDVERVIPTVLGQLASRARTTLGDEFPAREWSGILDRFRAGGALFELLTRWAEADSRPLVLLLDEVDTLKESALVGVLSQLRAGYEQRPAAFPQSVVLCGVRNVQDYRFDSSEKGGPAPGGSAFNIKAKSLRLDDFDEDDVKDLLSQHVGETGQEFEPEAVEAIWEQSRGQPWLVNALCREACFESEVGRDRKHAITGADVLDAREELIRRRETHLDQLAASLRDSRIRRVIQPILVGADWSAWGERSNRDVEFARDLGLIARDPPPRIANPIYEEVIPRELAQHVQEYLVGTLPTARFVNPVDGSLKLDLLLEEFREFFRENSESGTEEFGYLEAWPQVLVQAFLHHVVNSQGRISREHALGRRRADLLITWPRRVAGGPEGRTDRIVVECKLLRANPKKTIEEGLAQTADYMDRSGADAGHLVVFDRDKDRSWDEKVFQDEKTAADGTRVMVWGM